jgi:Flp pilus assembly protein TadB
MAGTGQGSVEERTEQSGCIGPLVALALLVTLLVLLRFGGATLAFALLGRPVGIVALVGVILAVFIYARRGARRRR